MFSGLFHLTCQDPCSFLRPGGCQRAGHRPPVSNWGASPSGLPFSAGCPLPQAWCSLSLEDGRPGLGVDRAMRPLPRSYPSHCPLCLPQSHRTTPSDWPQELLSLPLQAGACCRLLLPALKPLGILCSNRSWGKPDCGRLLTCLCWAPVTFPKPTGSAGPTDGGCSHPWWRLQVLPPSLKAWICPGTHPCFQLPPTPSPLAAPSKQYELFPLAPWIIKCVSLSRETSWSPWNADIQLRALDKSLYLLDLYFFTYAVGIMIRISQKVMETERAHTRCTVKYTRYARMYSDLFLCLSSPLTYQLTT